MLITSHRDLTLEQVEEATNWLLGVLEDPSFTGSYPPRYLYTTIYINGLPYIIQAGRWSIGETAISLASPNNSVDPLRRLAIISAIAGANKLGTIPEIVNALSKRLCKLIEDSTRSVSHNLINSRQAPTRIAVNMSDAKIAAEIAGQWFLPGGTPIEVTDSWTTMDF